jgi:sterol desaturase/sphingolipid hydroxylase (fatty acid hydroxylase superfamily)
LIAIGFATLCGDALRPYRLLDLSGLGIAGAALGLPALTLATYWMHRSFHASGFLFRWFHQMHHSAERIDVFTSFYGHPFEIVAQGIVIAVVLRLGLGLSATAAALTTGLTFTLNVLQHVDMRTPRWLGWLVQRPESHLIHHQRGVHAFNYGDLPLWDMIFGTIRNPDREPEVQHGFWDFASTRIGSMLLGRDVTSPPRG